MHNGVKRIAEEIERIAYGVLVTPEADGAKALTKNPLGPTGRTVASNIERLRTDQNLTFAALADRLTEMGRPIPPLGLRKIVAQTRRVDADDLVALAVALGTTPIGLLNPNRDDQNAEVEVTGLPATYDAWSLWEWLTARGPLRYGSDFEFFSRAWPAWLQKRERVWVDQADERQAELRRKVEQGKLLRQEDASRGDD